MDITGSQHYLQPASASHLFNHFFPPELKLREEFYIFRVKVLHWSNSVGRIFNFCLRRNSSSTMGGYHWDNKTGLCQWVCKFHYQRVCQVSYGTPRMPVRLGAVHSPHQWVGLTQHRGQHDTRTWSNSSTRKLCSKMGQGFLPVISVVNRRSQHDVEVTRVDWGDPAVNSTDCSWARYSCLRPASLTAVIERIFFKKNGIITL